MANDWQVPKHPAQREQESLRRRRFLWGTAGGLLGLAANVAVLLVALVVPLQSGDTDSLGAEYAGLGVILLSGVVGVALLITGGLVCIARRLRPFGIGLLIGTGIGLIVSNGVCFAIVVTY